MSRNKKITFVTGNQGKGREVGQLLSGLPIVSRKIALPREGESLASIVSHRILQAYKIVGGPCFTEVTALCLSGLPEMSGAQYKKRLLAEGAEGLAVDLGGRRGQVRLALAYTADGQSVELFASEMHGSYLPEARGRAGYGWDPYWLPDGYKRTLAEMHANKAFVNMRHLPYLNLGDHLRDKKYGGNYEAHVTIAPPTDGVTDFESLCDSLGVKAIVIELPRGQAKMQPMTASYHHGSMREVLEEVHGIAQQLASAGFDVTRVKLEAVGRNKDIPEDDVELDPSNYFEFHLKVILPPENNLVELLHAVEKHGAHLSRNARKTRDDGGSERFVTLRLYHLGRRSAEKKFASLVRELQELGPSQGFSLGQQIREYTVYDSNVGLDAGWLSS